MSELKLNKKESRWFKIGVALGIWSFMIYVIPYVISFIFL